MRKKHILLLLFVLGVGLSSCKKEGFGGDVVIQGKVTHHLAPIPNSTVYIKFNAKEAPGDSRNPNSYDWSGSADSLGNYSIPDLNPGNYYLYATGFDSTISQSVYGGIPVKVDKDVQSLTTNIPVTED